MTAAPITGPPQAAPSPAAVAAASHRLRASAATLQPVRGLAPVHTLPPPREFRAPVEPAADVDAAIERDRQRWADCSRGAHTWTTTPRGAVCLHCPTPQDQAARVQAARRARTVGA